MGTGCTGLGPPRVHQDHERVACVWLGWVLCLLEGRPAEVEAGFMEGCEGH